MLTEDNLGVLLRAIRLEGDRKQAEVAEAIGLSVPAVSKIETGRRDTPTKTLAKWAAACDYEVILQPADDAQGEKRHGSDHRDEGLLEVLASIRASWSDLNDVEKGMLKAQAEFVRNRSALRQGEKKR